MSDGIDHREAVSLFDRWKLDVKASGAAVVVQDLVSDTLDSKV